MRVAEVFMADFLQGKVLGPARWTTAPEDIRIVGASFDHGRNEIELIVTSETFTPVPDGELIPMLTIGFSTEEEAPQPADWPWLRVA